MERHILWAAILAVLAFWNIRGAEVFCFESFIAGALVLSAWDRIILALKEIGK